jgi:hypothetical protein
LTTIFELVESYTDGPDRLMASAPTLPAPCRTSPYSMTPSNGAGCGTSGTSTRPRPSPASSGRSTTPSACRGPGATRWAGSTRSPGAGLGRAGPRPRSSSCSIMPRVRAVCLCDHACVWLCGARGARMPKTSCCPGFTIPVPRAHDSWGALPHLITSPLDPAAPARPHTHPTHTPQSFTHRPRNPTQPATPAGMPGPSDYDTRGRSDAMPGGRFNLSQAKSDLEWAVLRAKDRPGACLCVNATAVWTFVIGELRLGCWCEECMPTSPPPPSNAPFTTPGPGQYDTRPKPMSAGGRFAQGRPKSAVDWHIHRAKSMPGPGDYRLPGERRFK